MIYLSKNRVKNIKQLLLFLIAAAFLSSCTEDFTPKPRVYPRVIYPQHRTFKIIQPSGCPFELEIPTYTTIEKEQTYFDEKPPNDCWFNIQFPTFNATIHCSYYPIKNSKEFEHLHEDAFKMSNRHTIRADYIEPISLPKNKNGVSGFIFNIEGSVASPLQFYLSDSTHHFLKGSLYFNSKINLDSLRPIQQFVKKDVMHILSAFKWK